MEELSLNSTFQDVIKLLLSENQLVNYDTILLNNPNFRRLFANRHSPVIPKQDQRTLDQTPEGSLTHAYQAYLRHYEFDVNFFPFTNVSPLRPVNFAAKLLNEYHDFFHVLGEYEASDSDEIALESFLLGQLPVPFAVFFNACLSHPEINSKKYKHLREVHLATISIEDVNRGKLASILAFATLESKGNCPVDVLRKELGIQPRTKKSRSLENSCGLRAATPFFYH